jgi:4a-hydroxytetrahydrobiopterin dehydratase
MTTLTGARIAAEGLTGWAHLLGGLQTRIATGDFATGVSVVAAIGAAAGELDHQAAIDLRHDHVDVRLTSAGGVTERDVRLARAVTAIAEDARVPLSATVSRLELALDTPDHDAVRPFWAAVLGVPEPGADATGATTGEVPDPADSLPTVWFQRSGTAEPRQRWHPDVWVDPAQVGPRVDAALAAGGTLVSDEEAPSFVVLADPDGNRVCLCTWRERD